MTIRRCLEHHTTNTYDIRIPLYKSHVLYVDSFPFLTFGNFGEHFFFVQTGFLIKLSRSLGVVLPANELQRGEIVVDRRFLAEECCPKVAPKRYQGSPHDAIGYNLMMVGFEEKEQDARD